MIMAVPTWSLRRLCSLDDAQIDELAGVLRAPARALVGRHRHPARALDRLRWVTLRIKKRMSVRERRDEI